MPQYFNLLALKGLTANITASARILLLTAQCKQRIVDVRVYMYMCDVCAYIYMYIPRIHMYI